METVMERTMQAKSETAVFRAMDHCTDIHATSCPKLFWAQGTGPKARKADKAWHTK